MSKSEQSRDQNVSTKLEDKIKTEKAASIDIRSTDNVTNTARLLTQIEDCKNSLAWFTTLNCSQVGE